MNPGKQGYMFLVPMFLKFLQMFTIFLLCCRFQTSHFHHMKNGKRKFDYANGRGGKGLLHIYNCQIYFFGLLFFIVDILWACGSQFWSFVHLFVKVRNGSVEFGVIFI